MAFTTVASAATSTTLLAENGNRGGASITNTDANRLYVLLDAGAASSTNYSFYLDSGDTWEQSGPNPYTGEVTGIWAADGSGAANITYWSR